MKLNLVTGHKGFIGSHLIGALPGAVGVDKKNGGTAIQHFAWSDDYETIFHLAADASIPQSFKDPIGTHTNNVGSLLKVLEYARKNGANVVFSSSSSVYGDPAELPTTESCPTNPVSPYAAQKLMCEEYCKLYWKLGVKSVSLRYFNVGGPGQENANDGDGLALGIFLRQKREGKPFTIFGDGEQRRDFVYVKDVVAANIKAAEWLQTATRFEAFNIGSGVNYSINEVLDMIDPDHPREYLPARPEPRIGLADITKARTMLHWEPTTTLKQWLS